MKPIFLLPRSRTGQPAARGPYTPARDECCGRSRVQHPPGHRLVQGRSSGRGQVTEEERARRGPARGCGAGSAGLGSWREAAPREGAVAVAAAATRGR